MRVAWNKGTKGICKPNSGSFKKGGIPWNKGLPGSSRGFHGKHTEEVKARISRTFFKEGDTPWNKGISPTSAVRQKISQSIKTKWSDPNYREKVLPTLENARKEIHRKPNNQEKRLTELIEKNGLPFRYTGDGLCSVWL